MFPDQERLEWFENYSRNVIDRCRRTVPTVPGYSDQPVTVYVPGGDNKYPSFWVRDAVMQCRSGLIETEVMRTMLEIILHFQNGPESRQLKNNLRVIPWAIPDHINLPGLGTPEFEQKYPPGAVFFPGTYSVSDQQGTGEYGLRPADDDIYEAVEMAMLIVDRLGSTNKLQFLRHPVKNIPVLERLHLGMQSMVIDQKTGLCWNSPDNWGASNFHDGLRPMGMIAVTSCLRFRAAMAMAVFYRLNGDNERAGLYRSMAEQITASIIHCLYREDGWILAASAVNRQPDVWSSSMAVYYGLLKGEQCRKAGQAMLKACLDGTIVNYQGYLRHTLTTADAISGEKVWEEQTLPGAPERKYGIYQTGGYWPQPLGYYCFSIAQIDPAAARKIASDYIDHTRSLEAEGAPFEWLNPVIPLNQTPALGRFYGPSAALPLEAFKRLS